MENPTNSKAEPENSEQDHIIKKQRNMKLASNTVNFNSGIEEKKKEKEKNGLTEKG